MWDHLRYRGDRVKPHSVSGQWTVETLLLNAEEAIKWRRTMLTAIDAIELQIATSLHTEEGLVKLLLAATDEPWRADLAEKLAIVRSAIAELATRGYTSWGPRLTLCRPRELRGKGGRSARQ